MNGQNLIAGMLAGVLALMGSTGRATAQDTPGDSTETRIQQIEKRTQELSEELKKMKETQAGEGSWTRKFRLGGYGDIHANIGEGGAADLFDIHRFVLYVGYEFSDWIRFHSETEIEHAFVSDGAGGELSIEQGYLDFLIADAFNVRLGRILTPLGITNKKHEPPSFNGVERPLFDKYIIPTTWSSDGVGIFGSLASTLKYEAYVAGGLDGSQFDATDGIREGRIKERPGLHEPAFSGRLDFYPLATHDVPLDQTLRFGLSAYGGGLDNGNKGVNPDIHGSIRICSGDVEYSVWMFDLRGAAAYEWINGAREIGNGTASDIFGWYLEGAFHFWPDSWKTGRLERSDAVVFVRYDDVNTQFRMPGGVDSDPSGDRQEWTVGLGFHPTPGVVIKVDYQIRDDASSQDLPGAFNLGVGFQF